jgi:cysteinyl-tRNA synthetase
MTIRLYNTLTKKKEEFHPVVNGKVGIYVCGITAYDHCHIGHARSAVVFDVLVRYFRFLGYEVKYVKNFTDIDDKIIDKARKTGVNPMEIAQFFMAEHDRVMELMGVAPPTVSPKATEHIPGMVSFIVNLVEQGAAYVRGGDVFFAVDNYPSYGQLSQRRPEELMAGARVEINERKQNPLDFVLWKASKEGEPWWESPWGKGRPGWHIECSVMSEEYLGAPFDIHGGGEDLVFPHHENEIAQSHAKTGSIPARYWLHNGFVRVNQEKMSKSLGNFFNIKDILEEFHPEVLRLFLLQSHYRSPLDFSLESLGEARQGLLRLYAAREGMSNYGMTAASRGETGQETKSWQRLKARKEELRRAYFAALDDDLNSARALGALFDLARAVNAFLQEKPEPSDQVRKLLEEVDAFLMEAAGIMGLLREEPSAFILACRNRQALKAGLEIAEIERLLAERLAARAEKDWGRADEIRKILADKGVSVKDTPSGSTWMMV